MAVRQLDNHLLSGLSGCVEHHFVSLIQSGNDIDNILSEPAWEAGVSQYIKLALPSIPLWNPYEERRLAFPDHRGDDEQSRIPKVRT